MYEDSLCGSCGQSAIHAFEPRNSGEFEVNDDTVCLGCEVMEQHGDVKHPAGTKVYVQNHMSED